MEAAKLEEIIGRIDETLRGEGYRVEVRREGEDVTLVATKGELEVCVKLQMGPAEIEKLLLEFSDKPGLTILRCGDPDRVESCIKKLVEVLRATQKP